MGFWNRLSSLITGKASLTVPVNDEIYNWYDLTGQQDYVSAKVALNNSDVFSIVNQVSSDIASSDMKASQPRTQQLLVNPSRLTNRQAFWQAVVAQLLLSGNAYAYIWRNINSQPISLAYLRPSQVQVMKEIDGQGLLYNLNFDEPAVGYQPNTPQGNVLHFRIFSTNGGLTGTSPLSALVNEMRIKDMSNQLTAKALGRSVNPNGILNVKDGSLLNTEDKINLSNEFARQQAKSNGPLVLDGLTEYSQMEIKSDVTKLLASTDWTSRQIAKVFGIPDSYLNGQGDQQSSIEMIEGLYQNALNRYANAIQSELNSKLTSEITIDTQPATDKDHTSYIREISAAVKNGALSGNQADYLFRLNGVLPENAPHWQDSKTLKGGEKTENN
ncbi:phage portal protein [Lactiplantibacillus plantarum]|uniref:phage portal protein n=1 Tax=Lactiplantibacillus plantarum TaxID=1590 RepID=UPI0030A93731